MGSFWRASSAQEAAPSRGAPAPVGAWACPVLISHGAVLSQCLSHGCVGAGGCIPGASLEQMNTFQKSYRISLYLQGDILGEIFN